jgi:serine/threonine protein kinase
MMSAEASSSASGVWTSLEGHVVNGVFPLRRFIGSSDHSGVFLSQSQKQAPSEVAIKLVPVIATPAALQLSRWLAAAELAHPHLLRIFEVGKCEVDGLHYLYAVMEYADQTLAQLLEHRAMTEDEAREMLVPTLNALAFLHGKNFVQGHLKPSNVLVVGDQLKLASDTNRLVDEVGERIGTLSVYHPPEARDGSCSTAGDIWALGVTVCEALTRRQPSGLRGGGDGAGLPPLSAAFREFVARCVRRSPHDRPAVGELEAWVRGQPLAPAPVAIPESAAMALLESEVPPPVAALKQEETVAAPLSKPRMLPIVIGAFVAFVLAWAGIRAMRSDTAPTPTASVAAVAQDSVPEPTEDSESLDSLPVSSSPAAPPDEAETETSSLSTTHEVIPSVPRGARLTIRGTVRVSVRVIVEQDGTVFAALTEESGPSRYFERLAIDAAKQWTFPRSDTAAQRLVLVRFAFSRDGTTARAVPLR